MKKDFVVAQEQTLGATGHQALLEYSPEFSTQHLRLLFSQCFVFTLDDEQAARIYSPSSAYFFVV